MWFINSLLALAIMLAPTPASREVPSWDYNDVRSDMFAGLAGDAGRLAKAMEACERTLAREPKHPEALVWHGAGLFFQSGQLFQRGDTAAGIALWDRGLAEMNEAVSLAPDSLGVVIPRGAVLSQAARFTPPAMSRPLLEIGVRDYERVLELQKSYFHTLGDHPKGELLFGLADGHARLGDNMKARMYFERLVADAPASGPGADRLHPGGAIHGMALRIGAVRHHHHADVRYRDVRLRVDARPPRAGAADGPDERTRRGGGAAPHRRSAARIPRVARPAALPVQYAEFDRRADPHNPQASAPTSSTTNGSRSSD